MKYTMNDLIANDFAEKQLNMSGRTFRLTSGAIFNTVKLR